MRFRFLELTLREQADAGAGAAGGTPAASAAGAAAGADPAASVLAAARAAAGNAPPAGAAPADGDKPAAGAAAAPTLEDQAKAGVGDWKAPDYLPENLRGKTVDETLQRLFDTVKGYRDKDAKREKLPEAPDGYSYTPSEKVKPYWAENVADDPVLQSVREAALAAEIPPSKFQGFMDAVLGSMVDMGLVDRPVVPDDVLGGMIPATASSLPREAQLQAAGQRVLAIDGALQAFVADKAFSPEVKREAALLLSTAEGLQFLEAVLPIPGKAGAAPGIQPGGVAPAAGQITAESLRQRQADPRNRPGAPQYDRAFEAETRRQYQAFYAGGNG